MSPPPIALRLIRCSLPQVLKWNFTCPRIEFVDQLHTQMEPSFSASLLELLFHANFKMHIKAYDILYKVSSASVCLQDNAPRNLIRLQSQTYVFLCWLKNWNLRFFTIQNCY